MTGFSIISILIIHLLLPLHILSSVILHLSSPHSISIYPHISFLHLLAANDYLFRHAELRDGMMVSSCMSRHTSITPSLLYPHSHIPPSFLTLSTQLSPPSSTYPTISLLSTSTSLPAHPVKTPSSIHPTKSPPPSIFINTPFSLLFFLHPLFTFSLFFLHA
jgi:hypothetical protein